MPLEAVFIPPPGHCRNASSSSVRLVKFAARTEHRKTGKALLVDAVGMVVGELIEKVN